MRSAPRARDTRFGSVSAEKDKNDGIKGKLNEAR